MAKWKYYSYENAAFGNKNSETPQKKIYILE
jgi:hypothetical protein